MLSFSVKEEKLALSVFRESPKILCLILRCQHYHFQTRLKSWDFWSIIHLNASRVWSIIQPCNPAVCRQLCSKRAQRLQTWGSQLMLFPQALKVMIWTSSGTFISCSNGGEFVFNSFWSLKEVHTSSSLCSLHCWIRSRNQEVIQLWRMGQKGLAEAWDCLLAQETTAVGCLHL